MATDPATKEESLYAAMTLPSLIVSTVGGGTRLPSQGACLDVIGAKHSNELAGVLAATCLAGEVSFYAAMVAGEFDAAHWNATHQAGVSSRGAEPRGGTARGRYARKFHTNFRRSRV